MMTMTGNIDKEKTPSTSTQNELSRDKLEQFLRGRASEASEINYAEKPFGNPQEILTLEIALQFLIGLNLSFRFQNSSFDFH